jgi:hypothetical protein
MAAPLSREVAAAAAPGRLLVFGGLTAGGKSADQVYAVRTGTGTVLRAGTLTAPLHDAAAAVLPGGRSSSAAARRPPSPRSSRSRCSAAAPPAPAPCPSRAPTPRR